MAFTPLAFVKNQVPNQRIFAVLDAVHIAFTCIFCDYCIYLILLAIYCMAYMATYCMMHLSHKITYI